MARAEPSVGPWGQAEGGSDREPIAIRPGADTCVRAPTGEGVFSCVVDRPPRLHRDAVRWFASLVHVARIEPRDLVVHVVGERSEALDALVRHGVQVLPIEPFDNRVPPCNKIAGALALARSGLALDGVTVLCDTDIAVVDDPRRLPIGRALGAKTVDGPNPPLAVLERAFAAAGLPRPGLIPTDCQVGSSTFEGNANGGLYVFPAGLLADLAPAWAFWATWLLESAVLGRHEFFVDQVAMALALSAEDIRRWPLPRRWNQPIHVARWTASQTARPSVIHYHHSLDRAGDVATTGNPAIDAVILTVNAATAAFARDEGLAHLFESGSAAPAPAQAHPRAAVPAGVR